MNTFSTPWGEFTLHRYPATRDKQLRAWDAADEYIISHLESLQEQSTLTLCDTSKLLILNDAFGALSIALAEYNPSVYTDSFLAESAIKKNIEINHIHPQKIKLLNDLASLSGIYNLVIIKVPKNLAMLEDELHQIREHCNENTLIIGAAMSKHIHTSTLKLFERIAGPTTTSLARKKARLIFSQLDATLEPGKSPYPSQYTLDETGEKYSNHANVFSREKLDIGSRFLLQNLPENKNYKHILDLACGNGVLGIAAAKLYPTAKISFVDESYMAVASARINAKNLLPDNSNCEFKVTDCLQGIENNSLDLILNNPPFHQNHVVGDFIAWQMFNEAKNKLKTSGEIIIVGNRHLGYHIKLKKLFGRCEMIASNKKFVILKAVKQ